jgi:hypothetical protein
MYKFLLSFVILSLSTLAASQTSTFDRDLELFQANCFGPNGELKEQNYIDETFTSCVTQAKYFRNEIVLYEDNYLADQMSASPDCVVEESENPVDDLAANVGDIAPRVKCSNQEKLDSEKSCGEAWNCNKYRSFITGTSKLPDFISDKVTSYAKKKVKENNYGPDCLNSNKSDCLEEFVTSIAGNFWSTVTSVWDLVKSGAKSLWNIGGWFDKKAETLHTAAVQNKESVTSFMDSPGKWFSDFLDKLKTSVNTWITETVFCQEWEGTAHFSKCKVPLESMDCIDCDSKMNATCAGIGALTSEFGMMFLTAGVGNVASITAKAGAATMRIVAQNAASKIKVVAPVVGAPLKKASKYSDTGVGKATKVVAKAAVGIAKLTAEQIAKLKGQTDKLITAYEKSKVVGALTKVADVATDPLSITTRASKLGVDVSNKILKKVGSGQVARRANLGLKVAQRAKQSTRVNEILKRRDNHAGKRVSTKGTVASRIHRKANTPPKPTGSTTPKTTPSTTARTTKSTLNHSSNNSVTYETRPSRDSKNPQFDPNANRSNRTNPKNQDQFELTADHKRSGHDKDKQSDGPSKKMVRTVGALTAADIANKVLNKESSSEDSFPGGGAFDLPGSSSEGSGESANLSSALNMGENASMEQMSEKAEALSEVYSEENRDEIVSRLQETNPGMSRDQANAAFSKRQAQIQAAKDQLAGMQRDLDVKDASAIKSPGDIIQQSQISELKSKKDNLDKLLANLQNEKTELPNVQPQAVASNNNVVRADIPSSSRRVAASSPRKPVTSSAGRSAVSAGALSSSGSYSDYDSSRSSELTADNVPAKQPEEDSVSNDASEPEVLEDKGSSPALSMMDMLKLAERDDVDISTDAAFPWEIEKVEALSDNAKKSLNEFSSLIKDKKIAKTKMKYSGENSHLEVYEFSNGKKYSFLIDVNKNIELIPESRTGEIIERFVKE